MRLCAQILAASLLALPATASVDVCNRTTHPSHGGVSDHVDYGNGKVGWVAWWSQEGTYKEVWMADCASGTALSLRTQEERITDRFIADRTSAARVALADWAVGAAPFFTPENMAGQVARFGDDVQVATSDIEFCGCHAAYPGLRGDKQAYEEHS